MFRALFSLCNVRLRLVERLRAPLLDLHLVISIHHT